MAYRSSPLNPNVGGTGRNTLTRNTVLVGNDTSAVTLLGSSDGQFLINSGGTPTFANTTNGGFVFNNTTNGQSRLVAVNNTSTTTGAAAFGATVNSASTGDAYISFQVSGGADWATGSDNSDGDSYVVSASATIGTTNVMRCSTAGIVTLPLQSGMVAYLSTGVTNSTGDGTVATFIPDTVLQDAQSEYNSSTGIFSCTQTGFYLVCGLISMSSVQATSGTFVNVTHNSVRVIPVINQVGGPIKNAANILSLPFCVMDYCTAGDSWQVSYQANGGTGAKTIGISGGSNPMNSYLAIRFLG